MSSVNRSGWKAFLLGLACIAALSAAPRASAEGVMFTVSSTELTDADQGEDVIGRLKLKAVTNWMQNFLGSRYDRFADKVNAEFAERYILEYKVSRPQPANKSLITLTGTLDSDSLKRWLRVAEVKTAGASVIKPLFILSSDAPGVGFTPRETGLRVRDSKLGEALFSHLNAHLQKLNARLTPLESGSFSLSAPAKTPAELKALSEAGAQGGYNGAIWIHVAACKSCGGSRLEMYFFNLAQGRIGLVQSADLSAEGRELSGPERIKKITKGPLSEFESEFDDLVSQGVLFSATHRVLVEGIDSYRAFKQINGGMGKLDFVTRAVLKRSEPAAAEYEVLSSLGNDELFQRFHLASFPGFQLKPVRLDGDAIIVRYTPTKP